MIGALPFRVIEHDTARPHQRSWCDPSYLVAKQIAAEPSACIEHVRDDKALTPKGAALLREFNAPSRGKGPTPQALVTGGLGDSDSYVIAQHPRATRITEARIPPSTDSLSELQYHTRERVS
jgi:hypothetical protein